MSDETPIDLTLETPVEDAPPPVQYFLYVKKHPAPGTLATRLMVPEGETAPEGYEAMDEEAFAAWLAAQSVPVASEPVPEEVTNAQFRVSLVLFGIMPAQIDAAISAMPEPDRSVARAWWDYANTFKRWNPLIGSLAPAFGLSSAQVDAIFRLAAKQE